MSQIDARIMQPPNVLYGGGKTMRPSYGFVNLIEPLNAADTVQGLGTYGEFE